MCLAIPGEILEVREEKGLKFGKVRFGGITRDVCLAYVPDAVPGEYVAVHVGFAISKIDPEQAAESLRVLEEIGQLGELTMDLDENPEERPS
ncbi:MAG TPA: HypC/HybG/HupF family hydrogenase formation chaperone [Thermoanaerobaculia bacterium]|nr:HypC/HybG/HupF family hydrogenase formation chaperone [Thermoanaerobaculia bacterium]